MSRIHEALKKAEQERLASGNEAAAADEAVLVAPVYAPTPIAPREGAEPLTLEAILANCAQPSWKPEPKTALMFNGKHVHGAEELRTLRSRLYQIRDRQKLGVVLITSALPAEGKTFLTANLGQMIVRQHDRRVLIIDADLRRSQLHQALGAPSEPGLTDYLRGDADELAVIQRGPSDTLFFIPGGTQVSDPAELLAGERMKGLLARVEPLFDWVLVDSPPSVPVADSSRLADLCDGVLLVVNSVTTPFDMAQRARDEFRNKRLLGVVLNRVAPSEGYHSYYYSYYGRSQDRKSKR